MRRILHVAGLAVAVVAGSGILFLLGLDSLVLPHIVEVPMVTVPDVRGRTAPAAQKRVAGKGLRLARRDSVYSETVPVGQIADQQPRPGERIKRARRVFVDISRGRRLYMVPDVTGGSRREAGLQIQSHQLREGSLEFESSTAIPEGVVLRQHPVAGRGVAQGSRVDLVVSSGSPFALKTVPDLVGLSIEVVEDSLHKYEMTLGSVVDRVAELLPPGQVLSQNPEGGHQVSRGTAIDLVVSVRRTDTEPESGER